jgi:trans-aconitate methyltransferase
MPTQNDFKIEKILDGSFRVTRTDVPGDLHTHMLSRNLAKTVIKNVCANKIPLNSRDRTLQSMFRLSNNQKYQDKIEQLLNTRKQKGKKDYYFNPIKK